MRRGLSSSMRRLRGFTIVELLIVIVVIAILAAITVVAYTGVQQQAIDSKAQSDLSTLQKAIIAARQTTGKTLRQITGFGYTAGTCVSNPVGTNLAALPQSSACWTQWNQSLAAISSASGIDVTKIVDPYGRPYFLDENEGEAGNCLPDLLAVYAQPFSGTSRRLQIQLPASGLC